ncbi:MAG TPA: hypothetical protein VFR85_04295 [Anaeromyxobacteraceae bacterium]|nr:hypothetical protein [Anaeromyxobacteraceae bacterium]
MLSSLRPSGGRRWPRGQRFSLSPLGVHSALAYREAVAGARAQGRDFLEAAERAWGVPLGLAQGDGVVLCQIEPGRRSLTDLSRSLEACGITAVEVKSAVDRLADAGLVEPSPPVEPPVN